MPIEKVNQITETEKQAHQRIADAQQMAKDLVKKAAEDEVALDQKLREELHTYEVEHIAAAKKEAAAAVQGLQQEYTRKLDQLKARAHDRQSRAVQYIISDLFN